MGVSTLASGMVADQIWSPMGGQGMPASANQEQHGYMPQWQPSTQHQLPSYPQQQHVALMLREVARRQQMSSDSSPASRYLAGALAQLSRAAEVSRGPEEAYILSTAQAVLNVLSAVGAPSLVSMQQPATLAPPASSVPPPPAASIGLPPPHPPPRSHLFEVVFINLRTRTDRRQSIEEQLALAGLQAARFEASTGNHTPDSCVARTWDSHVNALYDTKTIGHPRVAMSPGERGCAMSHRLLWEIIAARPDDSPPVLVLEDDAILTSDFTSKLLRLLSAVEASLVDPAYRRVLLYLCADVAKWRGASFEVEPGLGLREAAYLWQTAAYVMWAPAARALLPLASPIDAPVDVFLAQAIRDGHLISFVSQPQLAQQALPFQNGDILHSNFYQPHVLVDDDLRRKLDANQAAVDGLAPPAATATATASATATAAATATATAAPRPSATRARRDLSPAAAAAHSRPPLQLATPPVAFAPGDESGHKGGTTVTCAPGYDESDENDSISHLQSDLPLLRPTAKQSKQGQPRAPTTAWPASSAVTEAGKAKTMVSSVPRRGEAMRADKAEQRAATSGAG